MVHAELEALLRDRLQALGLADKVRLLSGRDGWTLHEMPQIGLRSLVTSDGPSGVRGTLWDERDPSLNVPNATALAATWDDALIERAGRLIGAEARKKGVHVLLAPTVALHRSPLGGRNFEAWSEDPYLTGRLATAFMRGVQSQGVGATAKHFVLNDSETERRSYDAQVDEDVLRELYLRPFEDLVRAGVWLVMAAYNRHAGALLTEHPMVRTVLKQEWGFDGVVVSDWHAVRSTVASARSGTDLEMPGGTGVQWSDALVDAVERGEVEGSAIDDKVLRILRLAARTGALEGTDVMLPEPVPLADAAAQLRHLAARGMVLLRNTGVLPLEPVTTSVALIGELAAHVSTQGGGASHVEPVHVVQPVEALRGALGARLVHEPGPALSRTLWPLPLELMTDPVSGAPGCRLGAYDADGNELRDDHRMSARFVFHGTLPEATACLRWTADVRLPEAGTHQLAVTGRGRFRLSIDGVEIADIQQTVQLEDDVQAIVHPPEQRVDVDLPSDRVVRLVVDVEPELAVGGTLGAFGIGYRPPQPDDDAMLRRAVDAAREADVAVVVVGATDDHESEGFDRDTLALPGRQDELVAAIADANPNTVAVINAGSVYAMPWTEDVAAILWMGMPGQEAGGGLSDVLTGTLEPWGRLTCTVPRDSDGAPIPSVTPVDGVLAYREGHAIGYRGHEATGATPQFAFGHGLGYTTWAFEAAELTDGGRAVTVTLRNTGGRTGREVVQVYLTPHEGCTRLVGFAAAAAEPGQRVTVTAGLDARTMSRWDAGTGTWAPLDGGQLRIGRSVADIALELPLGPAKPQPENPDATPRRGWPSH